MTHTDDDTVLALAIKNILIANKAALELDDVLYGNHNMIPRASAAIVTAMGKNRALQGVAAPRGVTMNTLNVIISLHYSKVTDEETGRIAADNHATTIENLIHVDTTVGGIIIHGYITDVARGETEFNGSMFRSVIMTYSGITKLPLIP